MEEKSQIALARSWNYLKSVFWGLCFIIPVFISLQWLLLSNDLPSSDSANYFQTTVRIAKAFEVYGFFSGLEAVYLERGWRPIFFPVLGLPFYLLTSSIRTTVILTILGVFVLLLFYTYRLARLYLSPERSALVVFFTGTVPWVSKLSHFYTSDLSLLVLALAFVYHLIRSDLWEVSRHSILAGFFAGLGVMIRPVEFLGVMLFVGLVPLMGALRKRVLGPVEVGVSVGSLVLVVASALKFPDRTKWVLTVFGFAWVVVAGCSWVSRRLGWNRSFLLGFLVFLSLSLFWWAGFLRELTAWISLATGSLAVDAYTYGKMSFFEALGKTFLFLGNIQFGILFTLFVFVWVKESRKARSWESLLYLGVAFAIVLLPVLAVSATPDVDIRRSASGFLLLLTGLAVFSLRSRVWRGRFATTVLLVLALLQTHFLLERTYAGRSLASILDNAYQEFGSPYRGGESSIPAYDLITSELGVKNRDARIAVLTLTWVNSSTMSMIRDTRGDYFYFDYPQMFSGIGEGLGQLRTYDYVFLDLTGEMTLNPANRPGYVRLIAHLREVYRQGDLESAGLEFVKRTDIHGTEFGLLKVKKTRRFRISTENNEVLLQKARTRSSLSSEGLFHLGNLVDGVRSAPWGTVGSQDDFWVALGFEKPIRAKGLELVLFRPPGGRVHIRDLRVFASDAFPPKAGSFRWIRARLERGGGFRNLIEIPLGNDFEEVYLELEPITESYASYGLAVNTRSQGDRKSYVAKDAGVYLRELKLEAVR